MEDDGMIDSFLDEAREHMSAVEECMLTLEKNGFDQELVNKVFRAIHSVKGSAGFFGFVNLSSLAHVMENMIDKFLNTSGSTKFQPWPFVWECRK